MCLKKAILGKEGRNSKCILLISLLLLLTCFNRVLELNFRLNDSKIGLAVFSYLSARQNGSERIISAEKNYDAMNNVVVMPRNWTLE